MGNYVMERGWKDHPVFSKEPYTEREAWEWLIENACWKETIINVAGVPLKLERGQLSYSQRYLEKAWGWKAGRAKRFLDKLKKWSMIAAVSAAGQQQITICNYNKYQLQPKETAAAAQQEPQQERSSSAANKNTGIIPDNTVVVDVTRTSHVSVGKEISKITGWDHDPNWLGNYSRIEQWLANGWDAELDIYPTVRQVMKNRDGPPRCPKYFEQAIADAYAARTRPLPEGKANGNTSTIGKTGSGKLTVADAIRQANRELGIEP